MRCGSAGRHVQQQVDPASQLATGFAGHGYTVRAAAGSGIDSSHHVGTGAAGGKRHQDVAWQNQGLDLSFEDAFESEVVAGGGEYGCVCGEGQRGQSGAVEREAHDQLRGEVLGVRGAAAIAEEDELAPGSEWLAAPRRQTFRYASSNSSEKLCLTRQLSRSWARMLSR